MLTLHAYLLSVKFQRKWTKRYLQVQKKNLFETEEYKMSLNYIYVIMKAWTSYHHIIFNDVSSTFHCHSPLCA